MMLKRSNRDHFLKAGGIRSLLFDGAAVYHAEGERFLIGANRPQVIHTSCHGTSQIRRWKPDRHDTVGQRSPSRIAKVSLPDCLESPIQMLPPDDPDKLVQG